jgi:hypothetical protein
MLPFSTATYITLSSLLAVNKDPELLEFVKSLEGKRTEIFVPTQAAVDATWKKSQNNTKQTLREITPDARLKAITQVRNMGVVGLNQNQLVEAILAGATSIVSEQPIVPKELKGVIGEFKAAEFTEKFPSAGIGYRID